MNKIAEAKRLIDEVNQEIPEGINFRFAVVELPTTRTGKDGQPRWQAYEDQFVTSDGQKVSIDGDDIPWLNGAVDIADGIGAALIAASRHYSS